MISQEIQEIIDQRIGQGKYVGKGYLEKINGFKQILVKLQESVNRFDEKRQSYIRQYEEKQGDFYGYFEEDPTLIERMKVAAATTTIQKIENCIKECTRLYNRFSRDSVNISVIGLARQGKSRLLQAISSLPNSVIPASNGTDCTGTISIIQNENGANTAHGEVVFYNEDDIKTLINDYLESIGLNVRIDKISDIPTKLNYLKEPTNKKEIQRDMTSKKKSWYGHLLKYIEHYDAFKELVGLAPKTINEDEIRTYVAQYDEQDNKTYNYLAVKEVHIFKEFTYAEVGKIVLVDTIGLGDTALGIKEKMLKTLRNNSDAAFMVRLPAYTGDHWSDDDDDLYDVVAEAMGKEMLDKWLYFVLNTSEALKNTNISNILLKEIEEKELHLADVIKVDCASSTEVQEKLVLPALKNLSKELKVVDKELMNEANKKFQDCFEAYFDLYKKAHDIIVKSPASKASLTMFGIEHWDNINKKIDGAIGSLCNVYKEAQYQPCLDIYKAIEKNKENIYNYIPDVDWYIKEINTMGIHGDPESVYINGLNRFRSKVSESFDNINVDVLGPLQDILKYQITDILYSIGQWGKVYLASNSRQECNTEWLDAFAKEKLEGYPKLLYAVNYILDYKMSMADLIDYEVEKSLSVLTPGSKEYQQLDLKEAEKQGCYSDNTAMGNYIWQTTVNLVYQISERLDKDFDLLTLIPSHSLYARIRKFREKVVMDEDARKELRKFYINEAASIWGDEYKQTLSKEQSYQSLLDLIETLPLEEMSNFKLSIG